VGICLLLEKDLTLRQRGDYMINDTIIRKACQAIDEKRSSFKLGESLIFYVSEADLYIHEVGSMPSYFSYQDKRYVVYKKPNK